MMPRSEHTGSHSSAEHEQSLLHSEKSASPSEERRRVLQGRVCILNYLQVIVFRGLKRVYVVRYFGLLKLWLSS